MLRIGNGFALRASVPRGLRVSKAFSKRQRVLCGAGFDPTPKTQKKTKTTEKADAVDLDDSEIEARLLQRRLRRKGKIKTKAESGLNVDTQSAASTEDAQLETNVLYVLSSLFGLIILNGIIIAASGFLPESIDSFVEKILYPTFSPLVVFFLVCSTLYGIWKTKGQKDTDE